jgi:integrating conjugative element protein (TIGR03749 family)
VKLFYSKNILKAALVGLSIIVSQVSAQPIMPVKQLALTIPEQQALKAKLPQDSEMATTLVWQGNPLSLALPLHKETRLVFSEPVQVDVNGQLSTTQLRLINDHQSVYLTALTAFENKVRIYVTLKNSRRIIFIDLTTIDHADANSAQVIQIKVSEHLSQPTDSSINKNNSAPTLADAEASSASADEWVEAVRFAWQQLYAPAYLLSDDNSFIRSPMQTSFWVSGLFYGDMVFAHPLASWAKDDLVITAIELRNPYPHQTTLDLPHNLCGHWRAAAVYPRFTLQPTGNKTADSTTLFLISSEPFSQALGDCVHGRA